MAAPTPVAAAAPTPTTTQTANGTAAASAATAKPSSAAVAVGVDELDRKLILDWTASQVASFISSIGPYSNLAAVLEKEGVTGKRIVYESVDDLAKGVGLSHLHLSRINRELAELKELGLRTASEMATFSSSQNGGDVASPDAPAPPEPPAAPIPPPPAPITSAAADSKTPAGSGSGGAPPAKAKKKFGAAAVVEADAATGTVDPFENLRNKAKGRHAKGETAEMETALLERLTKDAAESNAGRVKCDRCEQLIDPADAVSHSASHSSLIIENVLFLGAERNARNEKELITRTGVTHVLNMTWEVANFFPGRIHYNRIGISDLPDTDIKEHFKAACQFIDGAKSRSGRALVHCVQGVSRSSTIAIAYVMYHNRWPLAQAHAHVLSRRAVIKPNVGFWNQLCDWERELKLGPGTTPHPDSIVTPKFGSIVIGKVQLSEAEQKAAEEKQAEKEYEIIADELGVIAWNTIERTLATRVAREFADLKRAQIYEHGRMFQDERDKGSDEAKARETTDKALTTKHTHQRTLLHRKQLDQCKALFRRFFPTANDDTILRYKQLAVTKQSESIAAAASNSASATVGSGSGSGGGSGTANGSTLPVTPATATGAAEVGSMAIGAISALAAIDIKLPHAAPILVTAASSNLNGSVTASSVGANGTGTGGSGGGGATSPPPQPGTNVSSVTDAKMSGSDARTTVMVAPLRRAPSDEISHTPTNAATAKR